MRVTHIITRLIVGGAQENTIASVLGLGERPGLEVSLISGPSTGPEGSLEGKFSSHPEALTILPELVRPVSPWMDLAAFQKLSRMLRKRRPDIVHTHSGKAGILGRLAAHKAGVPVIIHTVHGPSFGPFQSALANALFRAAERHAAKVTTHFVVVADAMRRQYLEAGVGRPEQYSTIWSGFNTAPYLATRNTPELRQKFGLQAEDLVVGKIARLFDLKGHEDLIRVAPSIVKHEPRTRFLIVGDGPLRPRFESQIRQLGLGRNFVFTGLVDPDTVPSLVGVMDVLVHLSQREGLARALPQALAAGKPVIAYDCDGAREICLQDETGFLVQPHDIQGLETQLLLLLQNPDLRKRFGDAGRQLVSRRFDVNAMIDSLHTLYLNLASKQPGPDASHPTGIKAA